MSAKRVLIACESSGRVRDAFAALGADAWSCDILSSERQGNHIQGDVTHVLSEPWDLVIAHPPCTHLSASGARWWPQKKADGRQAGAVDFFMLFTHLACPWAIENPVGMMSKIYRKPDQIVQPWQFGEGEVKTTCLWLSGLPKLEPTNVVSGREQKCWKMPPGPNRARDRSRTYQGIANAMAAQWLAAIK